MNYQLDSLDKWIRTEIHPEALQGISKPELKEHLRFAISQKDTICAYFREKAIGKPPTPTSKFIQTHQLGLGNLIDCIIAFQGTKQFVLNECLIEFYGQICLILDEIVQFLQQNLPEYFDTDLAITYTQASVSRKELTGRLKQLDLLEINPMMDRFLYRIITKPFRDFIEENKRITYSELTYLLELANSLRGLTSLASKDDLIYEVHLTLWELNYNFPRYVLHFNYWLDGQLSKIEDRTARLDKLLSYLHAIEQIRVRPDFIFIPNLPPLSEQLLSSIRTTYQYLLHDNRKTEHTVVEKISQSKITSSKVNLSVSVSVLALSLKVLMKAGIIVNDNKADVFRTISENFTTMKSEHISYDSLRGKFSKTPMVAYVQLKQILLRMLEVLKLL